MLLCGKFTVDTCGDGVTGKVPWAHGDAWEAAIRKDKAGCVGNLM